MSHLEIEKALGSPDPEERRLATARLIDADTGWVELILRALRDPDWRVREEARQVARYRAPDAGLLEALLDALSTPEELGAESVGLRNAAADALGAFGEASVIELAQRLDRLDADGRKLAVEALAATGHPSALGVLRRLLTDGDPNVRVAALEAVANLGSVPVDDVAPVLEACLDDADKFVQLVALNGLNRLGVALAFHRIEPLLAHAVLRRAALDAAGRTGVPEAAAALVRPMNAPETPEPEFLAALTAMARLAERSTVCRKAVSEQLAHAADPARARFLALSQIGNEDLVSRRAAVSLLGLLGGEEAARILGHALADDWVREEAELAVCELGEGASAVLTRAVQTSEGGERAAALELFGQVAADLGEDARHKVVAVARECLPDPSMEVVRAALDVLGPLGDAACCTVVGALFSEEADPLMLRSAETALSALAERFPSEAFRISESSETDPYARLVLVGALGELAIRSSDAPLSPAQCSQRLCAGLSSPNKALRRVALQGLAALKDEESLADVVFALTDEEPEVRVAAVRTLGCLRSLDGKAVGLEHLLAIVESGRDAELMAGAAEAIGALEQADALELLTPLARSADPRVAVAAVEAIAHLPLPRRLQALRPVLEHSSVEVTKAVLRAMGSESDPEVLATVSRFLYHDSWDVRRQAADVLGRLGGEEELKLLRQRLTVEDEPLVREALERVLDELGQLGRSPPPPRLGSQRAR